jgi:hypothetical protein
MKINKILLIVFLLFTSFFYAQNKGISYQAVFYNPEVKSYPGQDVSTTPLAETDICLRFTILDESKLMEYEETLKVKTDKYGMVTTSIGTGTKIGGYANSFDQIVWGAANKILAVSVDKSGYCNSFIPVSESSFDAVPFSFSSISAVHVSGVVGVNNGGTGAVDAAVARVNLGAESVANKSTDIDADWDSDVKFPSVKSIKKYVDVQTSAGGYGNGSITNEKLAVDAVTDDKVAAGINKSKVGLDQVDNTSDEAKPISILTKIYVDAQVASVVVSDGSITDAKIATGINKSKVGLDQVDNTSDEAKPISTLTKNYVDAQVASVVVSDGSITDAKIAAGIDKSKVGLGQVDNTSDEAKPISTLTKAYVDAQVASGVVDGSITDAKITAGIDKSKVGLGQVDNTSDAAKPISTLTKAYVDAQVASVVVSDGSITDAKIATGINKSKVGLDQVDNTSDAAKPISTLTQTALNAKANIESPGFTGVPTAPTATLGTNTTQIATTQFVTAAMAASLNITSEQSGDYTATATDDIILMIPTDGVDHTVTFPTGVPIGKKIYIFYYNSLVHNTVVGANLILFSPLPIGSVPNLQMGYGVTFMYLGGNNWMSCTNN